MLNKMLTEDCINLNLKGKTKSEIIDEMVDLLYSAGKLNDKEEYKKEILKGIDIEIYPIPISQLVDTEGFCKILDLATDGYKLGLKHYLGIYKENKKTWNIFVKGGR